MLNNGGFIQFEPVIFYHWLKLNEFEQFSLSDSLSLAQIE
jgi:hypothetical protein